MYSRTLSSASWPLRTGIFVSDFALVVRIKDASRRRREVILGPAFAAADQTLSERDQRLTLCMFSRSLPPSNEFKCLQVASRQAKPCLYCSFGARWWRRWLRRMSSSSSALLGLSQDDFRQNRLLHRLTE